MRKHPTALTMHVAARTALKSMPVVERTAGCTKMMYDIVMNVVTPASISVRIVVREAVRWNVFSSKFCIAYERPPRLRLRRRHPPHEEGISNTPFLFKVALQSGQDRIRDFARAETTANIPRCLIFHHTTDDRVLDGFRSLIQA